MKRKRFISIISIVTLNFAFPIIGKAQSPEPEKLYFKDDGKIPNSKFPLLLYKNAFSVTDPWLGKEAGLTKIWM